MARPKKSDDERRSTRLSPPRCTQADKALIERAANAANLSTSEYQLRAALAAARGEKIKMERVSKADPELIFSLKAIGNNLNQIARRFNSSDELPPSDLEHVLTYIRTYVLKHLPE